MPVQTQQKRGHHIKALEAYVRPAAVKAGALAKTDTFRFGFHNLRHSLASFLVRTNTDPKTVQALLRHSDVKTTPQLYSHSIREDRMNPKVRYFKPFSVAQGANTD